MATILCQGLQSCLESHVLETTMLRLALTSPKSIEFGMEINEKFHNENPKEKTKHTPYVHPLGGWSVLQSLSNISQDPKEKGKHTPYVHPLVKPFSYSKLSEKSLELCTENLGSETGTDIIDQSSIFSSSSLYSTKEKNSTRKEEKIPCQEMESRSENSRNFPPPLTTISGANSLQVKRHSQGGRLIIKAIEAPPTHSYFQAERSNGRLRLCFFQTTASNSDLNVINQENEVSSEDQDDSVEGENDINQEEEEEEEEEGKYELDDEESEVYLRKDMDGNRIEVEGEMGMEKVQRLSKWKDDGCGNKGLCNWEASWVPT